MGQRPFRIKREKNKSPRQPKKLIMAKKWLVPSRLFFGSRNPKRKNTPNMIPKTDIGTPKILDALDARVMSQFKKVFILQKLPPIPVG